MSKLQDFAGFITTAQRATFTALDGNSRLNVVKDFYKSHELTKPVTITVTSTKRGGYLTKDEKLAIQSAYISALKAGNVSEELENNFAAVTDAEAVATFSETLPYTDAVKTFGPAVVAAKMIDALDVTLNEEFHKIRKFDVPAAVDIAEIPAFIKELEKIYKAATTPAAE